MSNPIPPGSTSVRRKFKLLDDAGLALDGKNAASLPDIYYNVTGAASVKIALVDLTAATDPWTPGGVWGLGRGEYSIDVPDAAFAAVALEVTLSGEATGMHVICEPIKVGYVSSNVTQLLGTAWLAPAVAGTPDVNAKQIGGTAAASATVGTVTNLTNAPTAGDFTTAMKASLNAATPSVTVSDKTGFSLSTAGVGAIWSALTSGMITAGSIGKKLADWVLGSDSKAMISTDAQTGVVLPRVTLVDTTAANSDMRGTDNAALAATALSNATWTSSLATNLGTLAGHDPGGTLATSANQTTILGRIGTPVGASISADIATNLSKWTTAITESYAADGSAPTPEQALMMILQSLHEFAISGTTRTVKKLDGSTTAMLFTLDDATNPTSTTRAS